jgi:hypothetical protein
MSDKAWSLVWSRKQNCFHIEPLQELLKKNKRAFFDGFALNDYHLICVGTRDQCEEFSRANRQILSERDGKCRIY